MKRDDDLFLDVLEQDEDVAWALAEAAARPAPSALRERIVARHRRRGIFGLPARVPMALAFAVIAIVVLPLSLALVQTRAELERQQAVSDEFGRVLFAVAAGGGLIVPMAPPAGVGFRDPRGAIVVRGAVGEAYLVLDLPAPPAGKAYEAWVIRDGQPIRAGMAPVRPGVVTVRLEHPLRPGDIAAVTLENAAGVDKPTADPLLVGRS